MTNAALIFFYRKYTVLLFFVFWGLWFCISSYLLLTNGSGFYLLSTYILYLIINSTLFFMYRRDLLSPPSLFIIFGFIAYGFNIPLIFSGTTKEIYINEPALIKVAVVLITAQIAFTLGHISGLSHLFPIKPIVHYKRSSRDASISLFITILLILICAGILRMHFHLGEAGVQPVIPYAGIFQYLLFNGVLLLCMWYLVKSFYKSWPHVLLGLVLLLSMSLVQALLGWRGGAIQVLVIATILFWYQTKNTNTNNNNNNNKRYRSLAWLVIPLVFVGSIMQLGNAVRSERLGGEREYATTKEDFIMKIFHRTQGTTRLTAVLEFFGPLTFSNNYLIKHLYSENITSTSYIDKKVYNIQSYQSHSVGTSGPGGPYVSMGLLGVFASYLLLGAFYRACYSTIFTESINESNALSIVLYTYMAVLLQSLLTENFGVNDLKNIIAACFCVYLIKVTTQK